MRVRFAHRSNTLCTPRKALLAAMALLFIIIVLNMHVLFYFYGMLLPGLPHLSCGANGLNNDYVLFYYYQWTVIRVSREIGSYLTGQGHWKIFSRFFILDHHHLSWTSFPHADLSHRYVHENSCSEESYPNEQYNQYSTPAR